MIQIGRQSFDKSECIDRITQVVWNIYHCSLMFLFIEIQMSGNKKKYNFEIVCVIRCDTLTDFI